MTQTLLEPTSAQIRRMTLAAFLEYAALPENADRRLQWHEGEMFEMVAGFKGDITASALMGLLSAYLMGNPIGYASGAQAGYIVNGAHYLPDGAYISRARKRAARVLQGYTDAAPEIAVEAISPTDRPHDVLSKLRNYEAAGTVVWLIEPDHFTITVYTPGQSAHTLGPDDTLDGGPILPGFSAPVKAVFAPLMMLIADERATAETDSPPAP